MAGHRNLLGDRPGALAASSIFSNTPSARVRLNYSHAGWQKTWGNWTVNTSFREAKVELRRAEGSSFVNNNLQDQWLVEGRYDSGHWTAGVGSSDVYRRSVSNPAMEPLEEIFDQGHTRMGHLYLVHRTDLTPSIRLLSGAALASIDGTSSALLTSELGVRLSAGQYLRIGMKPSMNRSGSNLFPEDLSTRSVGKSRGQSSKPLFRPDSKIVDYYAELPVLSVRNGEVRIRGFQTQFNNGFFASGDMDQVAQMSLTPLQSGHVTGVTTSAEWTSGPSFRATVATTFQSSRAFYPTLGHDHQLPNIPNFAAALTFDANVKDLSIALSANYLGPRMSAMTGVNKQGTFGTETRQENGIWSLDAHFSRPLGDGSLMLSLDNLTGAELYPGFGTSRSISLSYQKRF